MFLYNIYTLPLAVIKKQDVKNEYLRHTLATTNYRFKKSEKYRNIDFGNFSLRKESRSPKGIINHMYFFLSSTTIYIEAEII